MLKMEIDPSMTMSFIQARDPSIISYNTAGLNMCKAALFKGAEPDIEEPVEPEVKEDDTLKIFLRVKANVDFTHLYSISEKILTCKIPDGSNALRHAKEGDKVTKKFEFSEIFGPSTSQTEIFDSILKPKLLGFINGKSSTLLTYGASGAGKTFTIIGDASNPGLVPRALEYLFRTIPPFSLISNVKPNANGSTVILNETEIREEKHKRTNILNASNHMVEKHTHLKTYREMQKKLSFESAALVESIEGISVGVWISFAEIYNEYIYDLLVPPPPRGQQRAKLKLGNANGISYIKGLCSIFVNSGIEAYQILQYGIHNLNYAVTSLNSNSSRSHSIFSIKLAQMNKEGQTQVSHFNFCDLAGSERLKKTHNVGDRLKESNNINSSLMVLGKCIEQIRNSQKGSKVMVPYRESKLTQLFQNALSGKEDICMIVNVNPCRELFDETQHVLNFSAIAKNIIIEEETIKPLLKTTGRFSLYMNGRSTSIQPPIIEDDEEEEVDYKSEYETIEKLKNYIAEIQLDFETKWAERDELERQDRIQINKGHEKVIEKVKIHQKFIQDRLKAEHKKELEKERAKWQEYYQRKYENESAVIDLVSEDEDEENIQEQETENYAAVVSQLKCDYKKLELDLYKNEQRCQSLENENKLLKNKIKELNLTLDDAKKEYMALCEENQKESKRNKEIVYELTEKNAEQERYIKCLEEDRNKILEIQEYTNGTEDETDVQNMFISSLIDFGN